MRRLNLASLIFCLVFVQHISAQGVLVSPRTAFSTSNGETRQIDNATITVCAASVAGLPCAPALRGVLFRDAALSQPLPNPFNADATGNYQFAVAAGRYTVTETAPGFTGHSYQLTVTCPLTGMCTWTAPQNVNSDSVTSLGLTGGLNLSSLTTANLTATAPCKIGGTVFVASGCFAGATLGAQINAAVKSFPTGTAGVGIPDQTSGTVSSDIFSGLPKSMAGSLAFGSCSSAVSATSNVPANWALRGPGGFQGEYNASLRMQCALANISDNTPTFSQGAVQNVTLSGFNHEGSGTGTFIYVGGPASDIQNSFFTGKANGVQYDASNGASYDERNIGNVYKTTADSVLFVGTSFQSPNHRYRDNWFRKDDACCRAGKGINIGSTYGVSGDFLDNAFSGMTDAAHGTCAELGASRNFLYAGNDHENIDPSPAGNYFCVDGSNSNGGFYVANNFDNFAGGFYIGGNYNFVGPHYFTGLKQANFLQIFQGGLGNVFLGAPAGKTNLISSVGRGSQLIWYDDGSLWTWGQNAGIHIGGSSAGIVTHAVPAAVISYTETDPPAAPTVANSVKQYSTAGAASFSTSPGTVTIASGTVRMTTALIPTLTCGTTVTVSASGVTTTDVITWSFNAAPAANPAELVISSWPTANSVNFQYCNPTAGSVTPNAATLNWRVVR